MTTPNPLDDAWGHYAKMYKGLIVSGSYAGLIVWVTPYTQGKRGRKAFMITGYFVQLEDKKGLINPEEDEFNPNSKSELGDVLDLLGVIDWVEC
ncbi:MAG: hypothetical protein ACTII7_11930 [Galactobacter sp.]